MWYIQACSDAAATPQACLSGAEISACSLNGLLLPAPAGLEFSSHGVYEYLAVPVQFGTVTCSTMEPNRVLARATRKLPPSSKPPIYSFPDFFDPSPCPTLTTLEIHGTSLSNGLSCIEMLTVLFCPKVHGSS
jgi:hypothetical protein